MQDNLVVRYQSLSIDVSKIAPVGIDYLLQYGFAKSLQDSVAGLKKDVLANRKDYEKDIADGEALSDEELAEVVIEDKLQSRFEAIVAGTVGTRSTGARHTGVEKVMRDIAREVIFARAVEKKVKRPEGDNLRDLVEKYLANHAEVKALAEARMAATAGLAPLDSDDLAA